MDMNKCNYATKGPYGEEKPEFPFTWLQIYKTVESLLHDDECLYLPGGNEVLNYDEIMEFLKYIKEYGMPCPQAMITENERRARLEIKKQEAADALRDAEIKELKRLQKKYA